MTLEQIAETMAWAFRMRQLQAAIEGVTTPAPVPPWFRPDAPHNPDFTQMPGTVDYLAASFIPQAKLSMYQTAARGVAKRLTGRLIVSLEEADLRNFNPTYLSVFSLMARYGAERRMAGCDRLRTLVQMAKAGNRSFAANNAGSKRGA